MPRDFGTFADGKFVYVNFRIELDAVSGVLPHLAGYDQAQTPYIIATSALTNTADTMVFRLFYKGIQLLDDTIVRILPIQQYTYRSKLTIRECDTVTHIMDIRPPDFSLFHGHRYRTKIASDERFFMILADVVCLATQMLVSPDCVHVSLLQAKGVSSSRIFDGFNDTHAMVLTDFCNVISPHTTQFTITVKAHVVRSDYFMLMNMHALSIVRTIRDLVEDSTVLSGGSDGYDSDVCDYSE